MKANRIILRLDAGEELGRFPNVPAAKKHAETLDPSLFLVIEGVGGPVMARRWSRAEKL